MRFSFHIYHHHPELEALTMLIDDIRTDLAALRASVQANTVKDKAIEELISGYKAKLADLQGKLDELIVNNGSSAALQEISDGIKAVHEDMSGQNARADVTLNTGGGVGDDVSGVPGQPVGS